MSFLPSVCHTFYFLYRTPLSHRPKQGANFAWGQQSGAWGRPGNANLLRVMAALLGVGLSLLGVASKFLGETAFSDYIILPCVALTYTN